MQKQIEEKVDRHTFVAAQKIQALYRGSSCRTWFATLPLENPKVYWMRLRERRDKVWVAESKRSLHASKEKAVNVLAKTLAIKKMKGSVLSRIYSGKIARTLGQVGALRSSRATLLAEIQARSGERKPRQNAALWRRQS